MENSTTIISKKLGYHQILNMNNKSEEGQLLQIPFYLTVLVSFDFSTL